MRIINEGCHLLGDDKVQSIIEVCGKLNMQHRETLALAYLSLLPTGTEIAREDFAKILNIGQDRPARVLKILKDQGFVQTDRLINEVRLCWSYFETVKEQLELGVYDDVQEALKKIYEGEKQAV